MSVAGLARMTDVSETQKAGSLLLLYDLEKAASSAAFNFRICQNEEGALNNLEHLFQD